MTNKIKTFNRHTEIRKLHRNGLGVQEIALRVGMSKSQVRRIINVIKDNNDYSGWADK